MISRSARVPCVFAAELISRTLLGGIHRASVDLRFGLTATSRRATRAWFQVPASDARCRRHMFKNRSRCARIVFKFPARTRTICHVHHAPGGLACAASYGGTPRSTHGIDSCSSIAGIDSLGLRLLCLVVLTS